MSKAQGIAQSANQGQFKNRIINGDMRIDQRNSGASVTPVDGQFTLDRWKTFVSQTGKLSIQQNAGSVTPPVGYTRYLGVTSLSSYSLLSTDYFALVQPIEGQNVSDMAWGTANAATVTLSFWVRSSLTGTFGGSLRNGAGNRSYPFSYTIASANTWEQKSITIAGDTSGTWVTTNAIGAFVEFGLGVGSTYSGTAGAWAGSAFESATGATSVVGTNGATFYITGVQLEKGTVDTSFDYRPYGTELALCQRYFEVLAGTAGAAIYGSTANVGYVAWYFKTTKRATPTVTFAAGSSLTVDFTSADAVSGYASGYPLIRSGSTSSAEL